MQLCARHELCLASLPSEKYVGPGTIDRRRPVRGRHDTGRRVGEMRFLRDNDFAQNYDFISLCAGSSVRTRRVTRAVLSSAPPSTAFPSNKAESGNAVIIVLVATTSPRGKKNKNIIRLHRLRRLLNAIRRVL